MDRSPLDLEQTTMHRLGYRVTDIIADHLANIRDEPAVNQLPRAQLSRMLAIPAPLHVIALSAPLIAYPLIGISVDRHIRWQCPLPGTDPYQRARATVKQINRLTD